MGGLSACHQSFIQSLMARGALSSDDTKKLYNHCVQHDNGSHASEVHDLEELKNQIYIINKAISIADFTIRPAYSPWEDCTYWGLCNVTADDMCEVATMLRPVEVELFFAIVAELRDNDGVLTLPDAQNLSTKGLTVSDNVRAIQQMNQLQWLRIVRKSGEQTKVVIGPRSLIELPRVRAWAREFARGHHEMADMGARSRARVDDLDDDDDSPMDDEEDDEEEEEEIRPTRRRSARRVSVEEDQDDSEDSEDRVRSAPRSRRSQAL